MSTAYFRPSTPLLDEDCTTEARKVIQQFDTGTKALTAMFTIERARGADTMILKCFDDCDRLVTTQVTYDTAYELQLALSDMMDELEGLMGVNLHTD